MNQKTDLLVSQQLYEAVSAAIEAGWSINRIAQEAGISRPSLQYWYSGQRSSLALETINALCAFLGMRLTKPRIPSSVDSSGEIHEPRRKPKAKTAKKKKRGRAEPRKRE